MFISLIFCPTTLTGRFFPLNTNAVDALCHNGFDLRDVTLLCFQNHLFDPKLLPLTLIQILMVDQKLDHRVFRGGDGVPLGCNLKQRLVKNNENVPDAEDNINRNKCM